MFGYVIADFTRLSKDAKRRYKQNYCGLCHALRLNYGARARWLLNYDTAFLLLVHRALENDGCTEVCRCPYHFGKKRECAKGVLAEYAADVTVLLSCLKFEDDITDDNSPRAKLLKKLYRGCFERAKKARPELYNKLKVHLTELAKVEKANEHDPEVPASIFGALLGDVFGQRLYDFGRGLGRFIYLCDAACDFKSDIKRRRYNPFVRFRKSEIHGLLLNAMEDCTDAYSLLDIDCDRDIIENVLYSGVWLKYNLKYYKRNKK